jgi:ActR/RegA family two-component response regulator
MAEGGQHRILVIDDDTLFLEIARVNLERRGFSETADDPRQCYFDERFMLVNMGLGQEV